MYMYGEVRLVLSRVRQGLCLDVFCRVKQKRASPASQRAGVNPTNLTGSSAVSFFNVSVYIIENKSVNCAVLTKGTMCDLLRNKRRSPVHTY